MLKKIKELLLKLKVTKKMPRELKNKNEDMIELEKKVDSIYDKCESAYNYIANTDIEKHRRKKKKK